MDMPSENISPHEKYGFELLDKAFGEGLPKQWENDYARIFWQCLEVCNSGFEQWIGNTGMKGAYETLEALQRYSLIEAHRITQEVFKLGNLEAFDEDKPIHEYLEETLEDWFKKFRLLDEAYWQQTDVIHAALKREHHAHVAGLQ